MNQATRGISILLVCLIVLVFPGRAEIADSTEPTASEKAPPINPRITSLVNGVDDGTPGPELEIASMTIAIDQFGSNAEFDITIRIANPSEQQVEGRFAMQLPRDAVLTGYALDIDGRMVPGSLIDQPKARQVFEDEVRRGIDPGLAEITSGNHFSTRIFPILPGKSRTISLSFVTPVDVSEGLSIPLATAGSIGEFSLEAKFTGVESAPSLSLGSLGELAVQRTAGGWRTRGAAFTDIKLAGQLAITGSQPRDEVVLSRHSSGRVFFAIDDKAQPVSLDDDPPNRVRVYWDRSRSRADALVDDERALLREFLNTTAPDAIDMVLFAGGDPVVKSAIGTEALDRILADLHYRGATSFAGLDDLELDEADLCLLFTDGGTTLDHTSRLAPDCALITIASGANIDAIALGRIARDSGGTTHFLTKDNRAQLLERMQRMPLSVVSIREVSGQRISFRSLPAGPGRWKVVGEAPENAKLSVRLSGTRKRDSRPVYEIASGRIARHDAAGALWAAQEVAKLSESPENRDAMRAMAVRYRVASPTMAFLVLETPAQYVRAEIAPPDFFSEEWLEDYAELKREEDERLKEERDEHFEFVLSEWESTKMWWDTTFDVEGAIRRSQAQQANIDATERVANLESREVVSSPPPPPAMAPAPSLREAPAEMAEQAADASAAGAPADGFTAEERESNMIVVTGSRVRSDLQDTASPVMAVSNESFTRVDEAGNTIEIELKDVLSDQPYLAALKEAARDKRVDVLREQEKTFGSLPAFYLDTSEWFRLEGDTRLARELLLSALDLPTTNDETRQTVAFRLQRDGEHALAIALLERMAATTGYRPQPKRSLALALAQNAATLSGGERRQKLERAFAMLVEVAMEPSDERYRGIETIALMEANALIPAIEGAGGTWQLDERLVALLDADIRIAIEWTGADEDLDLWVTEPTGERVGYSNPRSALGGKITDDMTSGYGPEEYALRRSIAGAYLVNVNGFSGDRIDPNGQGRVLVRLVREFGRPGQSTKLIDAEIGFDRSDPANRDRAIATLRVED
ncbi:MAG: VIT domain-containing protein [Erythrobacter sp.]|nr:VIT domain-containing protein [Erythrobacter sp.]